MIVSIAFGALLELSMLPLGSSWMHILSENSGEHCRSFHETLENILQYSQKISLRIFLRLQLKGILETSNCVLKVVENLVPKYFDAEPWLRWAWCGYWHACGAWYALRSSYPLFNIFRKMVYCDPMQCPKKLLEYGFGPLECNQTTIGCGACNAKDI